MLVSTNSGEPHSHAGRGIAIFAPQSGEAQEREQGGHREGDMLHRVRAAPKICICNLDIADPEYNAPLNGVCDEYPRMCNGKGSGLSPTLPKVRGLTHSSIAHKFSRIAAGTQRARITCVRKCGKTDVCLEACIRTYVEHVHNERVANNPGCDNHCSHSQV
jgi:hypothetical protein